MNKYICLLALLFPFSTFAQETAPGDVCSTAGLFMRSGGPEVSGAGYFLVCDGSNWQRAIEYDNNANIGIQQDDPQAPLHVGGETIIGSTSLSCSATTVGGIRFNGSQFQICQDPVTGWEPLAGAGGVGSCNVTEVFSIAGSHNYTVPASFDTITIRLWGAGGGGAFHSHSDGYAGSASSILSLSLSAGGGGGGAQDDTTAAGGTGGIAVGGDTNTNGNAGQNGNPGVSSGTGANAPAGGGTGGTPADCSGGGSSSSGGTMGGNSPGSGGAGCGSSDGAGGGGSGSYVEKVFTPATLLPSTTINDILVGTGGERGSNGSYGAGRGADGQITITCVKS